MDLNKKMTFWSIFSTSKGCSREIFTSVVPSSNTLLKHLLSLISFQKANVEVLLIISNAGVQELDESQHDNNILGYNILNEGFYWKNSWFY